ncbi:hypothetical protein EIN_002770 [Entamoeba invadens IP1]|uniref:TLDc domain-containing protein n=1 Tax=Entamoeba invadens IP1 TaxID=370355 RepID=A0A0A1U1L9_ENTIV|nr:hypothetical protein EIN_002770 [Entamoeba invadens IP1]ELP84922.1 hypothetical protein EIN_002770 [Entamoeba invadens IP1]|eukprot:XP_004184268.1 hypothetical protein EIN_002770 [Entamoeba invadens IP1]
MSAQQTNTTNDAYTFIRNDLPDVNALIMTLQHSMEEHITTAQLTFPHNIDTLDEDSAIAVLNECVLNEEKSEENCVKFSRAIKKTVAVLVDVVDLLKSAGSACERDGDSIVTFRNKVLQMIVDRERSRVEKELTTNTFRKAQILDTFEERKAEIVMRKKSSIFAVNDIVKTTEETPHNPFNDEKDVKKTKSKPVKKQKNIKESKSTEKTERGVAQKCPKPIYAKGAEKGSGHNTTVAVEEQKKENSELPEVPPYTTIIEPNNNNCNNTNSSKEVKEETSDVVTIYTNEKTDKSTDLETSFSGGNESYEESQGFHSLSTNVRSVTEMSQSVSFESDVLSAAERNQLGVWSESRVGSGVFDYAYDTSRYCSQKLVKRISGCDGFVLVIVCGTTVFGVVVKAKVEKTGEFTRDDNAFVFCLRENGVANYKKYPIRGGMCNVAMLVGKKAGTKFFDVGKGDIKVWFRKPEMKMVCRCKQHSYEYGDTRETACGTSKDEMTVDRFVVFRLEKI